MSVENFRIDGVYCMSNWGGLEVMVESEDFVRYRENYSSDKPMRVSRPCKIYFTTGDDGRAYFRWKGHRIYLDECLRP